MKSVSMLSDTTYSTDFLNSRIINVEASSRKRKWSTSDASLMHYQSKSFDHCVGENGSSAVASSFATEFPDHLPYTECDRSLTYSFHSGIPEFGSRDERNIYTNAINSQTSHSDSKCCLGNREELSTPVMVTPLDTSAVLNSSNYLYGQINEAPANLNSTGCCYTFELTDSPCGQLGNGMVDNLDPLSAVSNRFDFARSAESSHSYVLSTQSTSPNHPGIGEPALGSLTSPTPCTPLFWFDDPGQSSAEADYDVPNCTAETFHPTHLDLAQSDQHSTAITDNIATDTFDEVYRACEVNPDSTDMDTIVSYPTDTSADAVASAGSGAAAATGESAETRRDKLTGKFKQNASEHSSTSEKLCKVCSDRAVNHNFGQLTCESCKAFFRRNAHKELTCTLKTGEHEITPTTRRECPACRLKKCFRVGMRPDLIQVRKKDGSKPRWLEKVPSAAIVHEKHLQATDSTCWSSLTSGKCKSDNGGDRVVVVAAGKQQQQQHSTKDCREEVCSTDSGSCVSNETVSLPLDSGTAMFGSKHSKGKVPESTDLMELGPMNDVRFTDSLLDTSGGPSTASGVALADVTQAAAAPGLYPTTDGVPSSTALITAATVNGSTVLVQPNATIGVSTVTSGLQHSQTIGYEMPMSVDQPPLSYRLNTTCTPVPNNNNKVEHLNGFEDFILLTNTPRLLVPTNVVTIATATSANQSPLSSSSLTPVHQTFGINLNGLELSQPQSLGSQLHYTTYTKLSPDQSMQAISPNNVLIESPHPGIGQQLLTPIWSSTSNSALANGIIQVATATEPIAQTLVSSMPKCVLATSMPATLQPITRTTLVETHHPHNQSTAQFKPVTVTGATSFRLSVQSVPASVGTVALTAVLPSAVPTQMIHRSIPTDSNLFLPTLAESAPSHTAPTASSTSSSELSFVFTDASAREPLNSSSSHIVIVPHSTTWSTAAAAAATTTATSCTSVNTNGVAQFTRSETELLKMEPKSPMSLSENANYSTVQWPSKSDVGGASQKTTIGPNLGATAPSTVSTSDSEDSVLVARCSLQNVNNAWTAMWRDGLFPNPDEIDLNIRTDTHSSLQWRLKLANMWDDIFVRRIAVFVVALFGPLCTQSVDQFPGTQATATWSKESAFSNATGMSSIINNEGGPVNSQPVLTWHDLLWLARHRFADCVPVLLISCLIRQDKSTGSEPGSHPVTMGPSQISLIDTADKPVVQSTTPSRQISSNLDTINDNSSISWLFKHSSSPGDVSPTSTGLDSNGPSSSFAQSSSESAAHTAIRFRCSPGGTVLLSLTNLSRSLAQLTVSAVRSGCEEHSKQLAYPILQYLDAYIAQFGNFLAHQPKLMGAFLALKLTDPHSDECINSPTIKLSDSPDGKVPMADHAERTRRLTHLHKHFVRIFSEAADSVALSSTRRPGTQTAEFACTAEIDAQEIAAANSRRAMLQEFLTWSRRFDTAWHEFQFDTWLQARKENQCSAPNVDRDVMCISRGLNALLADSDDPGSNKTRGTSARFEHGSQGLCQLLLDAKSELNNTRPETR